MGDSIRYLLAAYFGPRMTEDPRHIADRTYFLRTHLRHLAELPHKLAQITVIVNARNDADVALLASLDTEIATLSARCPVTVEVRENKHLSYGAWRHAWEKGPRADYYILAEDDYLYTQPDFDQYLLVGIRARPGCGFFCGAATPEPDAHAHVHAGAFTGIVSEACLQHAAQQRPDGRLFVGTREEREGYAGAWQAQIIQSRDMLSAGFSIQDWTKEYGTCFRAGDRSFWWVGDVEKPALVVPVQDTEPGDKVVIRYGPEREVSVVGQVERDGWFHFAVNREKGLVP